MCVSLVVKFYQIQIKTVHDAPDWHNFMHSFYGSFLYKKIISRPGIKYYSGPYEAFANSSDWKDNDPSRWMLMISYDRDIWTQSEVDKWRSCIQNYNDKHRVGLVEYSVYPLYLPNNAVNLFVEYELI